MIDAEFEQIIIKSLFSNPIVKRRVTPILDVKWFNNDKSYMDIVSKIIDLYETYEAMPTITDMRRALRDEGTLKVFDDTMSIPDEEVSSEFMIKEIEKFVKQKKMFDAARSIIDWCKTPDDKKKKLEDSFAEIVTDAETFSFDDDLGFNYTRDGKERIHEQIVTHENVIGSGFVTIDKLLFGGFAEKTLSLLLAPTNVGKTLMMCAMAANMIIAGRKVLYISFEDSENKIGQRITQNLMDLDRDELRLLTDKARFDAQWEKTVASVVKGNLQIKEFPEDAYNALMINSYIKDLEEKEGFVPEIVFIDYIGCMVPNGRDNPSWNSNTVMKKISSQVRAIAMKRGFPIVSGAQVNRDGADSAQISLTDIAESFGSATKADVILMVTQTEEYQLQNAYAIQVGKSRLGNNKGAHKTLGVDIDKQRLYDIEDEGGDSDGTAADFATSKAKDSMKMFEDFT